MLHVKVLAYSKQQLTRTFLVEFDFQFCCFQDVFQLHTPGGGGYGSPETEGDVCSEVIAGGGEFSKFVERGSVYEYRQTQEGV